MTVWTEGVCGDGAAILRDGVMVPVEEVIETLNHDAKLRHALTRIAEFSIPDQPAASAVDEIMWVARHVSVLRRIAAQALLNTSRLPRDQPTKPLPELVTIEGDDIVIRVTPTALKFATERGPALELWDDEAGRFRKVEVTDLPAWRRGVLRALRDEEENGDTPVHLLLDAALRHALEHGEPGISIEGNVP